MSLYTIILIASVSIPFILSFDKKLQFYKQWKYLIPSIVIIALFYIVGDIYFTKIGVWGFNRDYLSSIFLFKLPIEEWLFFLAIPYASIFLHDVLHVYFPSFRVSNKTARYLSLFFMAMSVVVLFFNLDKAYTAYIFLIFIGVLLISFFDKSDTISRFYCTFLVILVPFVLVNGALTGAFTADPVVWYDHSENLNLRFITIPIEDFVYGFTMLLAAIMLRNRLKNFWA
ncbi:MAG: lycopene cyclase domain-containing protein [Bacteroidales bacterium]|nr:lycopene cyclase domain-containing protein [Bacteroidales bacterium]MDD4671841.1 lycopene cyclase domain-containing protein [Bacteroidales bacterium]MDY0348846.1 lycopene cyclase domain-containing protein [Tenuifilaceae bacterium]